MVEGEGNGNGKNSMSDYVVETPTRERTVLDAGGVTQSMHIRSRDYFFLIMFCNT